MLVSAYSLFVAWPSWVVFLVLAPFHGALETHSSDYGLCSKLSAYTSGVITDNYEIRRLNTSFSIVQPDPEYMCFVIRGKHKVREKEDPLRC